MKYYIAIKRLKLCHFRKMLELEIFMLSEISQTQEVKYYVFGYMCNLALK
jgi:hypothetical protein